MTIGAYPAIGQVAGEQGGMLVAPSVDSALFSTPTETWTRFAAALSTPTLGAVALVSGGLGYTIDKLGGTAYRTPKFVNS
jgi:hypothetical protein